MHRTKEEFEKKLKEFFERHDLDRVALAHRIAEHFVNHQDEVFEHLTELYAKQNGIDVTDESIFTTSFGPNDGAEPF